MSKTFRLKLVSVHDGDGDSIAQVQMTRAQIVGNHGKRFDRRKQRRQAREVKREALALADIDGGQFSELIAGTPWSVIPRVPGAGGMNLFELLDLADRLDLADQLHEERKWDACFGPQGVRGDDEDEFGDFIADEFDSSEADFFDLIEADYANMMYGDYREPDDE